MELQFETKLIEIGGVYKKILLQNENGPCALVALTNVLMLSPFHSLFAAQLVNYVQKNDVVRLEDLVQVLANIGIQNPDGASFDVSQLLQILPQLHTGLNVNPIFNGCFAEGVEMSVFRLYKVNAVHGWVADPQLDPVAYQHVSKYSYEDAQNVLVQAYDITNKNLQVANANQVLEEASYLKSFLARSATQLTDHGLSYLTDALPDSSFSILFRNDHFTTLWKKNGQLFNLVTDAGYKRKTDIVWQSFKSVNGADDAFYDGNLKRVLVQEQQQPVLNNSANPFASSMAPATTTQATTTIQPGHQLPNTATNNANDADQLKKDEELARRLQTEEDGQYADSMQRGYREAEAHRTLRERIHDRREDRRDNRTPEDQARRKKIRRKALSASLCNIM